MVQIKDNKISLLSTLIDIYKDVNIKKAIDISIKNHDYNPFDLLFPYKSAKGKGKSEPMVLYISNDIYFDYVISGTKLIDEFPMELCLLGSFVLLWLIGSREEDIRQ